MQSMDKIGNSLQPRGAISAYERLFSRIVRPNRAILGKTWKARRRPPPIKGNGEDPRDDHHLPDFPEIGKCATKRVIRCRSGLLFAVLGRRLCVMGVQPFHLDFIVGPGSRFGRTGGRIMIAH